MCRSEKYTEKPAEQDECTYPQPEQAGTNKVYICLISAINNREYLILFKGFVVWFEI